MELGETLKLELARAARARVSARDLLHCYVQVALEVTDHNKTEAAKLLGVDRRTLYRLLERAARRGLLPAERTVAEDDD